MLVWTPELEALYAHATRLPVPQSAPRLLAGLCARIWRQDLPVIVVQTQCDLPEQERLRPPVDRGGARRLSVEEGAALQREGKPRPRGAGRGAGRSRALAAAQAGRCRDREGARRREGAAGGDVRGGQEAISQAEFLALCEEAGDVSSPPLLLDYLHNIGTVFYRQGLFGDDIILDQAWALDAVYAVFHREFKAFKTIERYGGRFRRSDLAEWVWQEHSEEEQELFLSFMQQCGICFAYRHGYEDIEAEYIAPTCFPRATTPR